MVGCLRVPAGDGSASHTPGPGWYVGRRALGTKLRENEVGLRCVVLTVTPWAQMVGLKKAFAMKNGTTQCAPGCIWLKLNGLVANTALVSCQLHEALTPNDQG